ncbi:MAG: ABC transporter permease subunit [Sarcina sp.]
MIKKMYNLTLNELIKEYKKKTIIIISILILASAVLVPFLAKAIEHSADNFGNTMLNTNVEYLQSNLPRIDTSSPSGKVLKAVTESELKQAELNQKYSISFNDWKAVDSQKYLDTLLAIDILNLKKENIPNSDILGNPLLNNVPLSEQLVNIPNSEINQTLNKLTEQSSKLVNNIATNNYLGYLNEEIGITKDSITSLNKEISMLETSVKNNPNNLEMQEELAKQKTQLNTINENLKALEFRYNNKVPFDINNWKSQTLSAMNQTIQLANTPILTEAQFMQKPISKITYAQYNAKQQEIKTMVQNQLQKDWYSLNNNIPQQQYANNSQGVVDSFVGIYSIIITLFIVIIAGGIVSSEFSRNTIKLLLVRPVSRFKVLLSKLLAVYIIGYVLFFLSMIIILITSGFVFGFSDMWSPVLKIVDGSVHTEPYILYFILHILFYSISLLCAGALAFMISTLTKSTAVSVAGTIILYIGLPVVTAVMLAKSYLWFTLTPFAYFNIPGAIITKSMIDNPMLGSYAILHMTSGAIQILVLAVIFIIISFIKFIKSDIR